MLGFISCDNIFNLPYACPFVHFAIQCCSSPKTTSLSQYTYLLGICGSLLLPHFLHYLHLISHLYIYICIHSCYMYIYIYGFYIYCQYLIHVYLIIDLFGRLLYYIIYYWINEHLTVTLDLEDLSNDMTFFILYLYTMYYMDGCVIFIYLFYWNTNNRRREGHPQKIDDRSNNKVHERNTINLLS